RVAVEAPRFARRGPQKIRGIRDFGARFGDRRTSFFDDELEKTHLSRTLETIGDVEQETLARARRERAPRFGGVTRRTDGAIDVFRAGARDAAEHRVVPRGPHFEARAARRGGVLPADEVIEVARHHAHGNEMLSRVSSIAVRRRNARASTGSAALRARSW